MIALERRQLLALTRLALLNGVALTLISAQFLSPPVFVIMLGAIPTIFAVGALLASPAAVALSGLAVVTLATLFFGPLIGAWMALYVIIGGTLGIARRWRWPAVWRVMAAAGAAAASLAALIATFLWFAGLRLSDLLALSPPPTAALPVPIPIPALLGIGFAGLAALIAVTIDRFVARVVGRANLQPATPPV